MKYLINLFWRLVGMRRCPRCHRWDMVWNTGWGFWECCWCHSKVEK